MAIDVRCKIMENPSHPAFMPGMIVLTGNVTLDNTKKATFTFASKYVQFAFGYLGTTIIAPTITVTDNMATVEFTAGANGILRYFIVGNITESFTDLDAGTSDITINPIS